MYVLSQYMTQATLKDLIQKAKHQELSDKQVKEILREIKQMILYNYIPLSIIISNVQRIPDKEKILKTVGIIEEKLRKLFAKSVDEEKLLQTIETIRKQLEGISRKQYLLIIFPRERGYNILHAYPELFTLSLTRQARKNPIRTQKPLPKEQFFELEDQLLGLRIDTHPLPDINGEAIPLATLIYPPKKVRIGKRRTLIRGRIGILYLVEASEEKPEKIWASFKNHILPTNAQKLPLAYTIIPIEKVHSGQTLQSDSPLNPKQYYSYRTQIENKVLKYIFPTKRHETEEAIIIRRKIIYNLAKEKQAQKIITAREILTYSKLLRNLLKLSDLITEADISEKAKHELDTKEEHILNQLRRQFSEYEIKKPLDIWKLYKNSKTREKAQKNWRRISRQYFPTCLSK